MRSATLSRPRWERVERALALLVFAWLGLRTVRLMQEAWPFTTDDAYITLRYARHLAEGHGIVWNVDEPVPVEGYSNFLFVLLGATAIKLGSDPVLLLKTLSCAALAPTCVLLYVLARRWLTPLAATLPALLLTSLPGSVYWGVSGLETMTYQLFVVAATTAFIVGLEACSSDRSRRRAPMHLLAAALCLLAALTRPEGPLLPIVLGVTALAHAATRWLHARRANDAAARDDTRSALLVTVRAFTVAFALPYAAYTLWRVAHFRRLLPNTVYCKAAYTGDPWTLIRDCWNEGKIFIMLALLQDPRKLGVRALPLFLLPAAYVVILFRADPIIGQSSRHFLAALALMMVASSTGIVNLVALAVMPLRALSRRVSRLWGKSNLAPSADGGEVRQRVSWAVLVDTALVLACLAWLAPPLDTMGPPPWLHGRVGVRPPTMYSRRMRARADLGRYLDQTLSPQQSYLIGDDGIVPYLSHASVIDPFCLNSRELTTQPIAFDYRGLFLDWVFERAPDLLIVHSTSAQRLSPRGEYGFYPALVADARFRARYQQRHAPIFGAPGDEFFYWIYERRPEKAALN
jgi:hypothetical protein